MRYLIPILFPITLFAETTDNLITNGTFDNGTTGWTLSGDAQRIGDCCPGGHDLEFGDNGSIEHTFDLINTQITQPMLDNGITLNSSVQIQNGECGVQGCWGGDGSADKTIVRLQILDENNNVLSVTTQERYDVTGIDGEYYTDSVSYTGIGSNMGNIYIFGSDSNSPATLGGPNVDNISVTMTYDPVVLTTAQTSQISTAVEEVEELEIKEHKFEEIKFTEIFKEEIKIEEEIFFEEEIKLEEKEFVEETIVFKSEEVKSEEIKFEEEIIEESKIEEVYEEIVESPRGNINETESIEEEETNTEIVEDTRDTIETQSEQDDSRSVETELTIEEISTKVADKIKTIDGQLRATQTIVAKIMAKDNKISSYSQVNTDIFIQPELQTIDIGTYTNNTYVDIRNIYPNQTYEDKLWTSRQ